MRKERNAVEKSLLEMSSQIKTVLAQRGYLALSEAGVERQKAIKFLTIMNGVVDETYARFSRPFEKSVEELVNAVQEDSRLKNSKSKK